MFIDFFLRLREEGLSVSLDEWLSLMDALDQGLAAGSLLEFYYLCRNVLVKTEADYDKFYIQFTLADNDAFITSQLLGKKLVADAFALPLDEYVKSGAFSVPEGAKAIYLDEPAFDEDGNRRTGV